MRRNQLDGFLNALKGKNYELYGPLEQNGEIFVLEVSDPKKITFENRPPFWSAKNFFVGQCETLFSYHNEILKKEPAADNHTAVMIHLSDLKAVILYDKVFDNDDYYQDRRKKLLIIGYGKNPNEEYLKSAPFDIFFGKLAADEFALYYGTDKGKRLLTELASEEKLTGINFSGADNNQPKMKKLHEKMKTKFDPAVWEELGKRCIECGKCTVACPTCFCFRIEDQAALKANMGSRLRKLDSCFYDEFSLMAGGHKSLKTTAEKIHFWYFHKFVRIPDQYGQYLGCNECMRCFKVCPANINIQETWDALLK